MTKPLPFVSRRAMIGAGAAAAVTMLVQTRRGPPSLVVGAVSTREVDDPSTPHSAVALEPKLLRRALTALDRHGSQIKHRDRIAIADFSAPSAQARFHVIDVGDGRKARFLVAHGSGSDPDHTGLLQTFSNTADSNASSEGAFVTADYYVGKHGRSQRLLGLDETNCNALSRAIVLHGAWYADANMVTTHGKLGRSQGCFAVGQEAILEVFDRLGEGRMIYAAKV